MEYRTIRSVFAAAIKWWARFSVGITLFAGLAAAQVGGSNQLLCVNIVGATPTLRGEGYSELTGDITITCTGGVAPTLGAAIPAVNIQLFYSSAVTSRLLPVAGVSSSISEALLIIDEPGSGLPAAVPGFGPAAGQNLCPTPLQGCVEYVSQAAGSSIPVATDTPQGTSATTPGKNVFQGIVSGNSVTFFGIPVLAPNSLTRTFRITNVRINAAPFNQGSGALSPVQASISISGSTSLLLADPNVYVGFVTRSLDASASLAPSVSQCTSQALAPGGTLSFAEGFGAAFKTRVAAQDNILYAGQNGTPGLNGFAAQNVPGSIYNSESKLVVPVAAGQTAGLADFGTRLKAVFNNVPPGVRLFVSVSNVLNSGLPVPAPAVPGGSVANTGTTGFAQLTGDEAGAFSAVAPSSLATGNVPVAEIAVSNGSAIAVWEVINSNPNATENIRFAVYASYTANPAQNTPPPGGITVNLGYGASPPNFTPGSGAGASPTLPVPRFIPDTNAARDLLTVTLGSCTPILSASISTSGHFTQGQIGATYTLIVSNSTAATGTSGGTVTVTDTLPAGLTATSISGASWSCTLGTLTCTRTEPLAAGSSYSPITVTVNVAANAVSPLVNQATVSGGGSAAATASNSTIVIGALTADSVSPAAGSGMSQIFEMRYSDTAGFAALSTAAVAFAGPSDPRVNSCFVNYERATNSLFLLNDAGMQALPGTPGATGTLENSACFVSLQGSSVLLAGNTLTLRLAMTFKTLYAGQKAVALEAADTAGSIATRVAGTWTVPATTAVVTADSVTPDSGSRSGQTFTLQFTDTAGAPALKTASVLFNATFAGSPANSCMLSYDRPTGTLTLLNDAGTQWLPGTLGSGTLQNSQCSVDLALSSVLLTGNSLILKVAMIFKPAFAGAKNVYMLGVDSGGSNSGWQARGSWTAPMDGGNTLRITCPGQATPGQDIACALQLPFTSGVVVDNLTFRVAVTPNGSAPALTTGQLGFGSSITGAVTNTAGTPNSILVSWTNTFIAGGYTPLGSLGFVIPASAAAGQSYSVTITSASASFFGDPVSISTGLPSAISIPVPGQLSCQTNVSVTPTVRAEGYAEQVGDITLMCIGGTAPALGAAIPQVDITLVFNTSVTSRLLPAAGVSNAISEALLLIDEPGSGLPPAVAGFGPAAPQNLCPNPLQGCVEYVSQKAGINVATDTPQGTAATTPGRNVFQGIVNGNSVTFYGVPVLAVANGFARVFRFTNARVNASVLGGGSNQGATPVLASIFTSGAASLLISNSTPTVGFVTTGMTKSAASAATLNQCDSPSLTPVTTLAFSENFGTAFKTRVAAMSNTLYAGQGTGSFQNVPGSIYNSESNLIVPAVTGNTPGLSDFGTRLKAQFNNVPAGVRLFVSVSNVLNSGLPVPVPAVVGGSAANTGNVGFAQLTASETGAFSAVAATSFANSGSVPVTEIPVLNGSGVAVWEIINTNPNVIETLRFAVFTSYTGNPAQNSPPPGTATVNLSYAPAPPSFAVNTGASASDALPVPRFIPDVEVARNVLNVNAGTCGPSLSIGMTHQGSFAQAQNGATYSVTVSNAANTGPTSGTVTVTETMPTGMTLVSMSGAGWTCPGTAASNCTRSDALAAGAAYPAITVTVNVAGNATSPQVNAVSVSGGGSAGANTTDSTVIVAASKALMSTPAPGSTLSGASITFTWIAGAGATAYWLDVGTVQGQGAIFGAQLGSATLSQQVTGIPTTGVAIYVRLWTQLSGVWQYNDYTYTASSTGPVKAVMSAPAPGTTLSGPTVTFTWSAGAGASAYWLDVGTVQGQGSIFGGQLAPSVLAQTVNGIPTTGVPIYVRLWTQWSGVWQYDDYTYTAASTGPVKAVMSAPAPGATLSGSTVMFAWTAGAGASAYWLDVGTVPGQGSIFGGQLGPSVLSRTVNGIPTTGVSIYVRLWTQLSGLWQYNDYAYMAANIGPTKAVMSTPAPGTTLAGSTVTFAWTPGVGASAFWLDVGTVPGQGTIFGGQLAPSIVSQTVNGIPTTGGTIYVRLWTQLSGGWQYNDYTYTAANIGLTKAVMSTPAPGTRLAGSTVTFAWTAGSGASAYWLDVGTVQGQGSIFGGQLAPSVLNQTVNGIPTNGITIYVRLWTQLSGVWHYNDYAYAAN